MIGDVPLQHSGAAPGAADCVERAVVEVDPHGDDVILRSATVAEIPAAYLVSAKAVVVKVRIRNVLRSEDVLVQGTAVA